MDPPVAKKRGRPRKRRAAEAADDRKAGPETKRQAVEARSISLLGRYVLKEFETSGIYLGKVVFYDTGLYRVHYEDGDCEDLESGEIRSILVGENDFDDILSARRKKLDKLVSKVGVETKVVVDKNVEKLANEEEVDRVESSKLSEWSGRVTIENDEIQDQGDADSSSDSSEYARDMDSGFDVETPTVPPLQLPPSSGTIGVPEQCVSHLFSVYGFMRSFSICLFLNPFTLDDFVGSLNYRAPNTLFDAIHVALLRALRSHLETLSSDGSEVAIKCLRCIDWSLLDTLTWPVYLVQYLTIMGYVKGPEWKGFYDEVLDREYYLLSVDRKLIILQIICDDVLESRDIRAELDMREESEVGIDYDAEATNPLVNGPRRVHPRYSKTSACKDREAMEIVTESNEIKSCGNLNSIGSKVAKGEFDATDVDADRNSDECRLCGMDGTLLCCDGCPSAYHTRCIGVMKLAIPEGSWYCPECTINKIGPTITVGTSVKGAQVFGIDSYEHIFVGTCNHLLVIKETINTEPCLRYYNQNDIPKILKILYSSGQHTAFYLGLFKAILEYWNIPESILSLSELAESEISLAKIKEDANFSAQSLALSGKDCHKVTDMVEAPKSVICVNEGHLDKAVSSFECHGDSTPHEYPHRNMKIDERNKMEYAVSTGSGTQQADPSYSIHKSSVDRSTAMDLSTCTPGNINSGNKVHANSNGMRLSVTSQSEGGNGIVKVYCTSVDDCIYNGSLYKPHVYINYYVHGDFAASAAAKLAVLSSEEARVSDVQASGNPRKVASSNNLWQAKAFSLTASRFFWPSFEKKLVEVPRERCGWCLSCKASVVSKRGCMLNHACLSATKGAMKILANLRPIKSVEGNLVSIATYILYMEESLHGLITGPFLNENFRKQFRQQVYQASTCSAIKVLLLELEENIRTIALSGEWIKLVDDLLVEPSVIQGPVCTVGTTQKRAPYSRRGRKQNAIHEAIDDECNDKSFVWWQGGKLSKIIFQRAILARSLIKKAARQGGSRKIFGVSYADGPDIPKRSRQSVWRAAVELSKNGSQLAVQVRYLDYHLRWSDLVRPEQNLPDGKAAEAEASAFRNASICDKKVLKNNVVYGVAFGSQKHLPSRVMKNIIETEQNQDGTNKFWFLESRIPLYLIKEYEESVGKVSLPSAQEPDLLHKLQRRQRKATHRDIFYYLECKRDNLDLSSCSFCQLDILLRNAVKCSACQGYCHESCTISSTVSTNEEVEFLITCKQCYNVKALAQKQKFKEFSNGPLPWQMKEYHTPLTVTTGGRPKNCNQSLTSIRVQESRSEMKQATTDSGLATKKRRPICSWGIIWKKKTPETGTNFRINNILLGGGSDVHRLKPVCHLCHMPYQSNLTYIRCESCKNWYHAEAVELEESKICDVAGFKCCKCRRIKSPICPYTDPKDKILQESKKIRNRRSKQENLGEDSDSATILDSQVFEPATPVFPMEEVSIQEDDPLLFALSRVELVTEHNSEVDAEWDTTGSGPRKLPVRRHVKREEDLDIYCESNISHAEKPMHDETNYLLEPMEIAAFPHVDWDASMNGFNGEIMEEYEDLNYDMMEPQTVFTINELLAPDGDLLDEVEAFADLPGNLENPCTTPQDVGPEQYDMATFTDESKSTISGTSAVNMMQCQICLHAEPVPDLSCEKCGLLIHNHCSPWIESSSLNDSWKCGQCREWR